MSCRRPERIGGWAMDWVSDPQVWVGLLTLTALEMMLGIDNLVFILHPWLGGCEIAPPGFCA